MEPMKKLPIVGLFLLVLSQPLGAQTTSAQENGRFQLLNAVVGVGDRKVSVLFKIDTVTGNTWRYREVSFTTTNGVPVGCDGWSSIGIYDENYDRLMKSLKASTTKTNADSVSLPNSTHPK